MGQPLNGAEAVSGGYSDAGRHGAGVDVTGVSVTGVSVTGASVTGVGVPNVLLTTVGELERGDVLGARYQIEAVIGTGGSGRVLRAFDRESRMPVALKILRPEFASDPVWTERFSRELRIGRSITHPNVCRVFDIGDADGHKFLSMELASRGSIRADVPKLGATRVTPTRPQRSWAERVADAQAVVDGVAALHAAGIVHRDLKPENILRMGDGRLVVTDFGLATDPDANGNTVMVGTPSYMAPEVVMGDPATKRSDVWGLGVVLHEILFGCRPTWKPIGHGYRKFILPDEVTTAAQRAAAELCGRCADDSAEMRPPSAVEVREELGRALRGRRAWSRSTKRQFGWGLAALGAIGALLLVRERWTTQARASSSQAATPLAARSLTLTTVKPKDWSQGAKNLASFAGHLHCYSLVDRGTKMRTIWGTPRRAEEIDVRTGARSPSKLLPETFQDGCPVASPDGQKLLFEKATDAGSQIFLSDAAGLNPRNLVRGSSPQWLPNGQEFALEFDSKHAALFSIPTGDITLVGDEGEGSKQLSEKTVDRSGTRIAIRYYSDNLENVVVLRSLPSLNLISRVVLPPSAFQIRFSPVSDRLLAAVDGGSEALEIASLDLGKEVLNPVGAIKGRNLREVVFGDNLDRFVVSEQSERDLWLGDKRLTNDGRSESGAMSIKGDLVIQRRLADGRLAIVLRRADGEETQVTGGPFDLGPIFLPDGNSWLHAKYDSHQIIRCEVADRRCSPIFADPLTPIWLATDPMGTRVAYISLLNNPRLHILTLTDQRERTLGPVGLDCPPFWGSANNLWVRQSKNGAAQVWVEIDVASGDRTGRQVVPPLSGGLACEPPDEIVRQGSSSQRRVSVRSREVWEISRASQSI